MTFTNKELKTIENTLRDELSYLIQLDSWDDETDATKEIDNIDKIINKIKGGNINE